jgi:hypothetical protein
MIDDALIESAIGRVLAGIGRLCIRLGHRLFLHMPRRKEGEGTVRICMTTARRRASEPVRGMAPNLCERAAEGRRRCVPI